MMSVRLDSEVARQAGKAALAAATADATSASDAKSTCFAEPAGGRIVDGTLAPGGAGDEPAADPVADPPGSRGLGSEGTGFGDLCHGTTLRGDRHRAVAAR